MGAYRSKKLSNSSLPFLLQKYLAVWSTSGYAEDIFVPPDLTRSVSELLYHSQVTPTELVTHNGDFQESRLKLIFHTTTDIKTTLPVTIWNIYHVYSV